MTAHTPKTAVRFELPAMLSYHSTWDDADYAPRLPQPRRRGTARALLSPMQAIKAALTRRTALGELGAMSDRELADIGINRYDLNRVFDPAFAQEYARRGL